MPTSKSHPGAPFPNHEPKREFSLQRRGLARKLGWGALGLLVATPLLAIALHAAGVYFSGITSLWNVLIMIVPALGLASLSLRFIHWKPGGMIDVEGSELVLGRGGREKRVPLARLTAGHVSPLKRVVQLELDNGDRLHAPIQSIDEGERLLASTGLDAAHRTMRMSLGETVFLDALSILLGPIFTCFMAMTLAALTPWPGPMTFVLTIALWPVLFWAVRQIFGPARLVIGADGIVVRQTFRDRFISYERLAAIDPNNAVYTPPYDPKIRPAILLRLTDGTVVRARTRYLFAEQRAELLARVEDARRAWRSGEQDGSALAQLDRKGRGATAWRDALRTANEARSAYRDQAVLDYDALVAVVESPAAPTERRIGAALALSTSRETGTRARIRVAAEACANPRVRVALEKAAEGSLDDRAIEEAIEADSVGTVGSPAEQASK